MHLTPMERRFIADAIRIAADKSAQPEEVSIKGYVLAVEDISGPERTGYMRAYGPQFPTREQAMQDAKLPLARGQKCEIWECRLASTTPQVGNDG